MYPVHHIPSSPKHSKRSEPSSPVLCLANPWAKIFLKYHFWTSPEREVPSSVVGAILCEMKNISESSPVACTFALRSGLYLVQNVLIGPFDNSFRHGCVSACHVRLPVLATRSLNLSKLCCRVWFCYTHADDKVPKEQCISFI